MEDSFGHASFARLLTLRDGIGASRAPTPSLCFKGTRMRTSSLFPIPTTRSHDRGSRITSKPSAYAAARAGPTGYENLLL